MQVLSSVTIKDPRIPVYSNVTAEPFTNAEDIQARGLLLHSVGG